MMNDFDLTSRRALVTGSSEGIGRAVAQRLAAAGAHVVLHGCESEADAALRMIRQAGGSASYCPADVADPAAVTELMRAAGEIDILVSNVALNMPQPLADLTSEALDRQFQINLKSFVQLAQGLLPGMRARRWGRLVTIGSVQEIRPHPDMLLYAGLKSAQANMVRNLARQFAVDGVTVNNVAPGVIDTARNIAALADRAYRAQLLGRIPMNRIGQPADIAGLVLLLCSDAGSYITGASIPVDGGMHL